MSKGDTVKTSTLEKPERMGKAEDTGEVDYQGLPMAGLGQIWVKQLYR